MIDREADGRLNRRKPPGGYEGLQRLLLLARERQRDRHGASLPQSRWGFIRSPLPFHPIQLADQPLDHTQAALPELGITRVEPEGLEQFGVMLGPPGREHREIALGEAFV